MNQYNDNLSKKVKDKIDIVEVVSDYVQLKKSGKNYKGLCPFHQEKTPSFTVNPDNQFYYCFGCGKGGDIFNFMMEIENITFYESLKILAKRAHIELPKKSDYSSDYKKKREKIFAINKLAAKFYNFLLLNKQVGNEAYKYLTNRGYTEKDMERYHIGYAPDSWHSLYNFLTKRDYDNKILIKSGVIGSKNNNYYDKFRDRVMFPIFNSQSEVIGFGGRRLNDEDKENPKYFNSPETPIFHKGKSLYGINWSRRGFRDNNSAVIMEGYTDVITAHKYGLNTAVASLGTALTYDQARLLKRYVDTVYIAFDPDFAGENATIKGLDILKKAELNVRVIELPAQKDPDNFIKENGLDRFKSLMDNADSLIEFKIRMVVNEDDSYSINQRISRSKKVLEILSRIKDPIELDVYLKKSAEILNIDKNAMKDALKTFNQKNKQENTNKNRIKEKGSQKNIDVLNKNDLLIKTLIDNPSRIKIARQNLKLEYFEGIYHKAYKFIIDKGQDIININIEDEVENEELIKYLMILTVKESQEVSQEKFSALLNTIKSDYKQTTKKGLYDRLKKTEVRTDEINNLLRDYFEIEQI